MILLLTACSEYIFWLNIYPPIENVFLGYYVQPLFRVPEFMVGMLIYDLYQRINIKHKSFCYCTVLILLGVIGLIVGIFFMYEHFGMSYNLYNFILLPSFGLIILGLSNLSEATWIYSLCNCKIIQYFATLTFTGYLCQSFSIQIIRYLADRGAFTDIKVVWYGFFLLTFIFSVLVHHVIELPGKHMVQTFFRRNHEIGKIKNS